MDDDMIKALIFAAMYGACPFCGQQVKNYEGPAMRALKSGKFGPSIKATMDKRIEELRSKGINPDDGHLMTCEGANVLREPPGQTGPG